MRDSKSFSQYYLHGIIFDLPFFSSFSQEEKNVLLVILKSNESVVRVAEDKI